MSEVVKVVIDPEREDLVYHLSEDSARTTLCDLDLVWSPRPYPAVIGEAGAANARPCENCKRAAKLRGITT